MLQNEKHVYNSIFLSHSVVDWVIVELLCVKQGERGGRARYILKDTVKYLPLYGWMLSEVRMSNSYGSCFIPPPPLSFSSLSEVGYLSRGDAEQTDKHSLGKCSQDALKMHI